MICKPFSCIWPCCFGQIRFMIAFMCFIGVILMYCHRSVLNIAIVEMVGRRSKKGSTCPVPAGQGSSTIKNIKGGKVDWDEFHQNLNIASFFIGYLVMHIPGGVLCDRYGARYFLLGGFAVSTITTAAIPLAAVYLPWWSIFLLRIISGAGQGVQFPGISSLLSRWIPPTERATVGSAVFAATSFGLVLGNTCTGLLIKFLEDWTYPFYLWGVVGVIYMLLFIPYVFSDPRTHPFLTEMELNYLKDVMAFKQPMKIPWWAIIKDRVIYGLIFAQIGHNLIVFTLSNNLPKYMNNVLGFNIRNNALVSFIFILQWVSSVIFGSLADYLVKKKNANLSWMRKIYTAISNIMAGVFLVCAGLCRCNYVLALFCFGCAIFFKGIFFAGMKVNIIDISVNHSALVMSIVNGMGSISGYICSHVIGTVAKDNTHEQWFYVFTGMLVAQLITILLYCTLSSCDRRDWDYSPGEEKPVPKKANHWYLQMTPSDHEARLVKDENAKKSKVEAAKVAKEKMKEEFEAMKAAKAGRG